MVAIFFVYVILMCILAANHGVAAIFTPSAKKMYERYFLGCVSDTLHDEVNIVDCVRVFVFCFLFYFCFCFCFCFCFFCFCFFFNTRPNIFFWGRVMNNFGCFEINIKHFRELSVFLLKAKQYWKKDKKCIDFLSKCHFLIFQCMANFFTEVLRSMPDLQIEITFLLYRVSQFQLCNFERV